MIWLLTAYLAGALVFGILYWPLTNRHAGLVLTAVFWPFLLLSILSSHLMIWRMKRAFRRQVRRVQPSPRRTDRQ